MTDSDTAPVAGRLLATIDGPADLKRLSLPELEQLATELRQYIVEVVARRGGHLGSTLGAIELTIALHRVFDTPRDKLVWDVGHQTYAHKILTGRRDAFRTLRSFGGIAGFLKRAESEYDCFGAGHASTAISAAVGFAQARDLKGSGERVVAIVGDGALTGGLSFEGLNQAGDIKTDLLVILNDNVMSIAENVGALSTYLNRLITAPLYHRIKNDVEDLLGNLSEHELIEQRACVNKLGRKIFAQVQKMKEGLKTMIMPSSLFEELGFTYYGPMPGHDLSRLLPLLEQIRTLKGPILLHVVTCKGKGFEWAENHPEKFHGTRPGFDPESGEFQQVEGGSKPSTWTDVFAEELLEIARADESVVAITAAMPSGTGLDRFRREFPERMIDVGIAEEHAVVAASAMAAAGMKPVVAVYSTFLQRSYDMIIHDACLQKLPVFFAIDRAGVVGEDGETHQGVFDMAFLRMIPNIVIMAPKDECELRAMMRLGIGHALPVAVRYPRGTVRGVRELSSPVEMGRAEMLREGKDVVVLAFGPLAVEAAEVADKVAKTTGRSIGVVNMRFVKPLDRDLVIRLGREVKRLVTYEEGVLAGGAGAAVLETLADAAVAARVRRVGVPDIFVEHGRVDLVRTAIGLAPADLERAVLALLEEKGES